MKHNVDLTEISPYESDNSRRRVKKQNKYATESMSASLTISVGHV